MSSVDVKSILGAVLCGLVLFGLINFYESSEIAEIQAAGPEDEIVPPSAPVLFCVNHKLVVSFAFACLILGLASYGSTKRAPVKTQPPDVPPAKI